MVPGRGVVGHYIDRCIMACKRGHTHFIVFTHACGYYSRAATISLVDLQVRLLFGVRLLVDGTLCTYYAI